MKTLSSTFRFGSSIDRARGALILVHGRGSSPADIARLADSLDVPDLALLAPAAATGSWYPQRFFVPLELNEPSLSAALATIEGLVAEVTVVGIRHEQIGVIGFSQGACLALEHLARSGPLGVSGRGSVDQSDAGRLEDSGCLAADLSRAPRIQQLERLRSARRVDPNQTGEGQRHHR